MEALRIFLNTLTLSEQRAFAIRCGTTRGYLRKAISMNHDLGPALCVLIEKYSNEAVTRKQLHPADWNQIWPELSAA